MNDYIRSVFEFFKELVKNFVTNNKLELVLFSISILLLLLIGHSSLILGRKDLALSQAIIFPIVYIIAYRKVFRFKRSLKIMFGIATVMVIASLYKAYSFEHINNHEIIVAKLKGDQFESESRIFRNQINQQLDKLSHIAAKRSYKVYKDQADLVEEFEKFPQLSAIVWGGLNWINVSFKPRSNERIADLGFLQTADPRISQLKMIFNVPTIGLSKEPALDTATFIAALIAGEAIKPLGEVSDREFSLVEGYLISAGSKGAHWSSYAHRAYPWWALGNHYTVLAFTDATYQPAYLACAVKAYQKALEYITHPNDNVVLYAAIYNNLGIARAIGGYFDRGKKWRKQVKQMFKRALASRSAKNIFNVDLSYVKIVRKNLNLFRIKKRTHAPLENQRKMNKKMRNRR